MDFSVHATKLLLIMIVEPVNLGVNLYKNLTVVPEHQPSNFHLGAADRRIFTFSDVTCLRVRFC